MQAYLIPTKDCDCAHPQMVVAAGEMVEGAEAPADAAKRIFHYVRDEIPVNATLNTQL